MGRLADMAAFSDVYGVFVWTEKNRYPAKDAVRVYRSKVLAQKFADRNADKNYVVRTIWDPKSREAGLKEVVDRIVRKFRDGDIARRMVDRVTRFFRTHDPSDDLSRDEVRGLYRDEDYGDDFDVVGGKELDVGWTDHAEYRSDLRDVDPSKVNEAVRDFADAHPGVRRKVTLTRPGMGRAVVDVDATAEPERAAVVTVMASGERLIRTRAAARTKYLKVEPTAPGSKNHYKVTYYDGTEKWVDARPGRGMPSRREQRLMMRKLKRPSVQRAIDRLDDALEAWRKDGEPGPLQQAVEKNEVGLDRELAKTVNRLFVRTVKENAGEDIDEKTAQGLQVVKEHVNRNRRDAMDRLGRMAERVAAGTSLQADLERYMAVALKSLVGERGGNEELEAECSFRTSSNAPHPGYAVEDIAVEDMVLRFDLSDVLEEAGIVPDDERYDGGDVRSAAAAALPRLRGTWFKKVPVMMDKLSRAVWCDLEVKHAAVKGDEVEMRLAVRPDETDFHESVDDLVFGKGRNR